MNGIAQLDVKNALNHAIQELSDGSGYYAPLVERFPIITDGDIPPAVLARLRAKGSPACTDNVNVYVDSQELANTINMAIKLKKDKDPHAGIDLYREVRNILCHEYTHILCQHVRQGQRFNRDNKNGNIKAFMTACEIEANRGYLITHDEGTYMMAVTDEHFPETKLDNYLPQIYKTLKDKYGGELDGMSSESKNDDENEDKDNGNESGSEAQNDGTSNPTQNEDENGAESQQNAKKGDSDDGEMSKQQKDAVQRMLEVDMDIAEERMTAEDMLPHDEDANTEDEDTLNALGLGGGDEEFLQMSPQGKLEYLHKKWQAKNLKMELEKVKGIIAGTVSRERVSTYSRQSKKQGEDGLMMKGHKRSPRSLPKILLAMDSSGSMCSATMKDVATAIAGIFDTCGRPTKGCYICKHTHNISPPLPMKRWKEVADTFRADGGNDFTKVMALAIELDVDVVLNVGDGQDYCTAHSQTQVSKDFINRGIKWFDCNVKRDGLRDWEKLVQYEEWASKENDLPFVKRYWIDLTGEHPLKNFNLKGEK